MSTRSLVLALVAMVGAVVALHFTCLWFFPKPELDPYRLSDFYPLSVFKLRWPRPYQLGIAALYAAAFFGAWPRLSRTRSLPWLIVGALGFAVLSNLLHGFRHGLDFPTATTGDAGIEYYHDARIIPGPLWLLRHYNVVQFELLEHSRTHPPGPVLLYWLFFQGFRHPAAISVAVCAVSLWLTLEHLRRLLRLVMGEEPAGALLVFSLIPSVLVYGLATVDAVIAGLFLAALVCFVDDSRRLGWLASAGWLWLCLMFTFAALVLFPILAGFELLRRRSLRRFAKLVGAATLSLALTQLCLGFDWGAAFWKASVMENEQGFLLLAHPRRYVWYRLGGVAEILLFFSPFLTLLAWRGLRPLKARSADGFALAWLGPAALSCFLLAGALKIGEAARACLFILPYLALPALVYWRELSDGERFRVASGVWGFGVIMQLFGFYQW